MLEPNRNRVNGCWKRKTVLEKKLSICTIILTIVAVILVILYIFQNIKRSISEECTSKHCVKAASEILEFVDFNEDPCEHFYKFVCGSYQKHAVKKDTPSPFVSIKTAFENEMKSLIVDPIRPEDSHAHVLVKQFYHECMNESRIDEDKNRAFLKAIHDLGGWPLLDLWNWQRTNTTKFDWFEWLIRSTKLGLPIQGFFAVKIKKTNSGGAVLWITGQTAFSDFYITKETFNNVTQQILKALGLAKFESYHSDANEATHTFIKELRKMPNILPPNDTKTIKDLQQDCPVISWLKLLNSISGNETMFDNSSVVLYGDISNYCDKIDKLVASTKPWTIANFYIWSLITNIHQYLSSEIRQAYSAIHLYTPSRFETCYKDADKRFRYVKETIYIRKRTPDVVREQLIEMINIMKEVFMEHLHKCDWMDDETKERALGKTKAIVNLIGGGPELYDEKGFDKFLGVDGLNFDRANLFEIVQQKNLKETKYFFQIMNKKDENDWSWFFKNMMQPNAFFLQPLNMMIIPAPVLSSIFYDHRKPGFMNYGSLGRLVGHEIMHGFEKSGRYVMAGSQGIVDWWTDETADAYDKKVQCVIDRYEKIKFRYKMNGTVTLDENVSDLVGIDVAYESYKKYIKIHGTERKLPGVPLTPEQVFWVQTGTFLCFRKLDDNAIDFEEEDSHAIPIYRVQAGARNSKFFAKDFGCAEGTFMNPKNKCRIL